MRARQPLAFALLAAVLLPLGALADDTLHFPQPQVDAAFAKGMPLAENAQFKIHASRRDAPGVGEVHLADTDILHVLTGRAVLVTGGVLEQPSEVAPGELRGPRIAGGVERRLAPGDVVVVPNGTPHWFKTVEGPVTYFVVKTTATGAVR